MHATPGSTGVDKAIARHPRHSVAMGPLLHVPLLGNLSPSLVRDGEYRDVFLAIVERTGAGLAMVDARLRIQETNQAFVTQSGHAERELRGHGLDDLLHPSIRQHL